MTRRVKARVGTARAKGPSPADAVNAANTEVVRGRELNKHIAELRAGAKTTPAVAARVTPKNVSPENEPFLPRVRRV